MGPIHALRLQPITTGILAFGIADDSMRGVGKNDINISNIIFKLGNNRGEPKVMFDRYWINIHISNDTIVD
jgi:hypothetical protein